MLVFCLHSCNENLEGNKNRPVREGIMVLTLVDRSLFCKHLKLNSAHTHIRKYILSVEQTV